MKPERVGGLFLTTGLWLLVFPSLLAGQPGNPRTENENAAAAVQSDLANGLYLVLRWTVDKDDLLPLLENEILIEHDPRFIEPDSKDPVLYVTVGSARRVLFQQMKRLDPVAQEDGRINLQVTLSDDSADQLETMSRQYLGRQVATVIGGRALTLHKIRSIIRDGQLQITRCTDDGCRVILQQLLGDR